ncbi:unnamed protein product, partial [Iphiclides podalirius]
MCANSDTHTFCQYSEGPGPQCIGFMPAALTKEEKINIIMRMNHRRNDAALGMLGNLPSAGDMLTLRWVEELAHEAQLWANQCSPPEFPEQHDLCRDLYSVPVGQNVASVVGEAPGLRVESMVDLWFMQGRHYKGNLPCPPHNLSYYGDFAQMLWSPTFMVGCARSIVDIFSRCGTVDRAPSSGWLQHGPTWPTCRTPHVDGRAPRHRLPPALPPLHPVRRELRSTESEEFKKFKMELERTKTSPKRRAADEDDTLEDYKNKVVLDSKGSLFQSLVSYLPNVKTFGIGAGSEHNTACAVTSSLSVYISPLLLFYE